MTFEEFYQNEYVPRHADKVCRLFHVLGLVAAAVYVATVVWSRVWWLLVFAPVPTYLVAWVGHMLVHNKPTFFEHPVWSFLAYWRMMGAMATGQI
jgi:hypothetical protein